ncbi:MAG TPA: hypothetical protein VHZ33_02685 [Trebonia sp.]|jgi:hypothetical protein|nr:hypothetical protein [Trebonia sp.]
MISPGRLDAQDRAAWERLFAGYHAFYGRPSWPQENYDEAWRRFQQDDEIHALGADDDGRCRYDQAAENRGFIQYVIQL